ncbi:MAG: hypothetical protein ACLUI7_04225 [Coprococcus sp.]
MADSGRSVLKLRAYERQIADEVNDALENAKNRRLCLGYRKVLILYDPVFYVIAGDPKFGSQPGGLLMLQDSNISDIS